MEMEPSVRQLMQAHGHTGSPAELMRKLNDELRLSLDDTVPVDLAVMASGVGARVEYDDYLEEGSIRWDHEHAGYVIRISTKFHPSRRPFTLAHEINHVFFLKASGERSRLDRSVGEHHEVGAGSAITEEALCDLGAAELLLPFDRLRPWLSSPIDMAAVGQVATDFGTSVESTARRLLSLSNRPTALVILELKLKPIEIKNLAREANAVRLFDIADEGPKAKLRVKYAVSFNGFAHVPKDKSVSDECCLALPDFETADYTGPTGLIPGLSVISARYMPLRIGDENHDRVIAILSKAA